MGKSWLSAVKKALSPEAKEKKQQKPLKKKKKWFGKPKKLDHSISHEEDPLCSNVPVAAPPPKQSPKPKAVSMAAEDVKREEVADEQTRHAYSVAYATAVAAERAVAAAQAAAEVVRLTGSSRFPGKSREEIAAIKIQTAFRGYMARRALRALRGLVRLKNLIQGQSVKRQATSTLQCMQTLARVQYQIRERRLRLSEDNQARLRQLQQRHDKDFDKTGKDWNDSTLSREQIEANMLSKQIAATRRERALAYAFSHQTWKNSKSGQQMFMDPNNPHWGWSWLERWMAAARPCDDNPRSATLDNADKGSIKSSASRAMSEITPQRKSPSPKPRTTSRRGKLTKPSTPRMSYANGDDDSRSMMSVQSEQPCHRRHSICGSASTIRDDESITSCSQSVPSYMAPTQAAKAKARFSNASVSPLGLEKMNGHIEGRGSSAKKRLSFSASPRTARRFSGPPKLESNGVKHIGVF